VQWFTVIGRELRSPTINEENIYNMDESGVQLSVLNSMKMLVSRHFTRLYGRSRDAAFTDRNIRAGWVKTGLHPFNPDRVLREIQKPPTKKRLAHIDNVSSDVLSLHSLLPTSVNVEGLEALRKKLEQESQHLDAAGKHRLQKLANAGEKAIADRALLVEEDRILFDQNNEKISRSSTKCTVVETARIMSYDDIMEAQRKGEAKKPSASRPSRRNKTMSVDRSRKGQL
jgi:hypothetical protein